MRFLPLIVFILSLQVVERPAHALTRTDLPGVFSLEVLGKGVFWGLYFDYAVASQFALGIGVGTIGINGATTADDDFVAGNMIPIYANLYLGSGNGSVYLTGGATAATTTADATGLTTPFGGMNFAASLPIFYMGGLGWENRNESGFTFRGVAYALIGDKVYPWVGFSAGYAF